MVYLLERVVVARMVVSLVAWVVSGVTFKVVCTGTLLPESTVLSSVGLDDSSVTCSVDVTDSLVTLVVGL